MRIGVISASGLILDPFGCSWFDRGSSLQYGRKLSEECSDRAQVLVAGKSLPSRPCLDRLQVDTQPPCRIPLTVMLPAKDIMEPLTEIVSELGHIRRWHPIHHAPKSDGSAAWGASYGPGFVILRVSPGTNRSCNVSQLAGV